MLVNNPIPTHNLFKDLTGQQFNSIVVTGFNRRQKLVTFWNCRCDCGKELVVSGTSIRIQQSCGCTNKGRYKHGESKGGKRSSEYRAWSQMKFRCENPAYPGFKNYGGRGIKVCERWHAFAAFLADMGRRPSSRHSIDRFPDNNGNYDPDNCRWATPKEQTRNYRRNRLLTFDGKTMCLTDWATTLAITRQALEQRLKIWPLEKALTTRR